MYFYDERLELDTDEEHMNPLYTLRVVDNEGHNTPIYRGNYQEDLVDVINKYVALKMRQQNDANTKMFENINRIFERVKEAGR